jgi:hypothetical protein
MLRVSSALLQGGQAMSRTAIVAGTGFEGRAEIIRKHCRPGTPVSLKREPSNQHDPNAVAVSLRVPRLGGILGSSMKKIGYVKKGTAKSLARRLDEGAKISGRVHSMFAPEEMNHPRVTVELDY